MRDIYSSLSISSRAPSARNIASIHKEYRQHMVAQAAYFYAQHRSFQGGDVNDDWYRAEAEINARFVKMRAY